MRAELSAEQQQLYDMARSLAADLGPETAEDLPAGRSGPGAAWKAMRELGLLGLHVPERLGGSGAGPLELALVTEAFATQLAPVPVVGANLAVEALVAVGADELVAAALAGDIRPVIALRGGPAIDGFGADHVVAVDEAGVVLVGDATAAAPTADRSRMPAALEEATATAVGALNDHAGHRLEALMLVLTAADLVGTGAAALDDAVAYGRHRHQFGRPVGSFQAVKHLAADAHVRLVGARAPVWSAAWRLPVLPHGPALLAARRAKAVAAEAGRGACEAACQMLGGIGHTWEHLASVRLRRALVSRWWAGDEAAQYDRLHGAPASAAVSGVADGDGYDLRDDPVELAVRRELREWLADNGASAAAGSRSHWHRALAAARWVGLSIPAEQGGRGLPLTCEAILNDELGAAGMPPPAPVAHLAHAIARHGSPAQQESHLRGLLTGTERWCQGFSEPDAGSDLAALSTRAHLGADGWTITGRKIWTSDGAESDWCLLLCRTEPEADKPRHHGLSMLLVPLATSGVDVQMIRTAWGSGEFAEVSFDGATIPAENLLGERGQGWQIAMSLLEVERGPADVGWIARFRRSADHLIATATGSRQLAAARGVAWLEALSASVARSLTRRSLGVADPAEGSVDKLLMTEVDQLLHAAALDNETDAALLTAGHETLSLYLWSRAAGIFGGTSQIQRNIVSERLLGLPR